MTSPTMDAKSSNPQNCSSYKLKFGIDRLLSSETTSNNLFHDYGFTQKQSTSLAVPCSGCVTSMLRCCSLNPRTQNLPHDCSGYSNLNLVTAGNIYSIQPIRPFATRPQVRMSLSPTPSISPTQLNTSQGSNGGKRKRSWSRAVFSNLQRKGLERRFQLQKYITKPDRRQLAATLGLTDAQVKVWFQNRRMKWRHTKEISKDIESTADSTQEELLIDVDTIQEND